MKYILTFIIWIVLIAGSFAQPVVHNFKEIFIIDSFISPQKPYKFKLSFFTDQNYKSKLVLDSENIFPISEQLVDEHKSEIELTDYEFDSLFVPYYVLLIDSTGKEFRTETYHVEYPYQEEIKVSKLESLLSICAGSVVFFIPSIGAELSSSEELFSLSKELPLFAFYSGGFNYPTGYLGLEYSYTFKAKEQNKLRFGYKQIFEVSGIEFISPGVSLITNFKGGNGIAPEASIGLFKFNSAMTLYARYRYNVYFSNAFSNFHDVSIGIYSHFFSLNF